MHENYQELLNSSMILGDWGSTKFNMKSRIVYYETSFIYFPDHKIYIYIILQMVM